MQPRQPPQLIVAKGLDTETETIDAGVPKSSEEIHRDGFGIRLECNFGIRCNIERFLTGVDNSRHFWRREKRRRPAAEINGVSSPFHSVRAGARDLGDERCHIPRLQTLVQQAAVEVAIVADRGTERDVEVETEHGSDVCNSDSGFRILKASRSTPSEFLILNSSF